MNVRFGRAFRRMGLPFWTFVGIGVSAIWFNALGNLAEAVFRRLFVHGGSVDGSWQADFGGKLFVFAAPFVVVAILVAFENRRARWRTANLFGGPLSKPDPRKGLILLVSNEDSAMYAIRFHAPALERVWLIPSDSSRETEFGPSTLPVAESIVAGCKEKHPGLTVEIDRGGVSPADAQDTFDLVNRIFRRSDFEPADVIADFTGGTKPMSVGMIMACLPADRELEYIALDQVTRTSSGPYLVDYQHRAFDLVS